MCLIIMMEFKPEVEKRYIRLRMQHFNIPSYLNNIYFYGNEVDVKKWPNDIQEFFYYNYKYIFDNELIKWLYTLDIMSSKRIKMLSEAKRNFSINEMINELINKEHFYNVYWKQKFYKTYNKPAYIRQCKERVEGNETQCN